MKFYVGVTNNDWYDHLAGLQPDEVNFWKPSGVPLKQLQRGDLFLFKLKSPRNAIGGGGIFVDFLRLPLDLAWEVFGEKNGTSSYAVFKSLIINNRTDKHNRNPEIGCVMLAQPFFFPKQDWIQNIPNWSTNLQSGRYYDTKIPQESRLWDYVQLLITVNYRVEKPTVSVAETMPTYGSPFVVRPRLGQGAFRALVTEAYERRCAITAERTLPVLEAAHIKPYGESGPHNPNNGLLLRADLHKLFDRGYITVTQDYHVEVSSQIKEEFDNGREYYAYHGSLLRLPSQHEAIPSREYLSWHNDKVYKG